jgi:uncharacterized membrane protein
VLLLAACIVVLLVALPLVFKMVPPNRIYGFRTTTTLARTDVWYRSNIVAGLALIVASALSASIIMLAPWLSVAADTVVFVGSILAAVAVPFLYLRRLGTRRGRI